MERFGSLDADVSFDVLSRFPTKDLVKLKHVSKGWQNLITNQSFVQIQSKRKEPLSGFFYQQRFLWSEYDIETINYIPVKWDGTELHKKVFDFLPQDVVILTTCNGLVCCRSCFPFEEPAIFVCNPLNKEWVKLEWTNPDKEHSIALAFDPFLDFSCNSVSFKLIRAFQSETEHEQLYFSFDIYSSKTKSWNLSKEICWCNSNLDKNKGVYIRGAMHWLTDEDQILTFNFENELALLISAPVPAMEFNTVPKACIGEWEGCLHYVMISEEGLHVWFLEDYFELNWSLKQSKTLEELEQEHPKFLWNIQERVKLQMTDDVSPCVDPLAFKDEILVLRVSSNVYLYDIIKNKMEEVCDNSKFGTSSMYCPTVLPYSMTLVPLLN